jgi:hypothetical protein
MLFRERFSTSASRPLKLWAFISARMASFRLATSP